jgi:tetratricopeptide (TPR) repeat protein
MFGSVAVVVLAILLPATVRAAGQSHAGAEPAVVQGCVRDSSGHAVSGATVQLRLRDGTDYSTAVTDAAGNYRFASVAAGSYRLRAEFAQSGEATVAVLALDPGETRTVDLVLRPGEHSTGQGNPSDAQRLAAGAPEFFDPPHFTVAGVTDTTNLGGHGSDTLVRNREALAKETVALGKEPPAGVPVISVGEKSLRAQEARNPAEFSTNFDANYQLGKLLVDRGAAKDALPYLERASRLKDEAEVRHLLGDVEETLGDALAAVREYQRAAELSPSEPNLFDWGSELLLHRAPEPAIEVFAQGNRLFPRSVRMMVGLGVARYARGDDSEAEQTLCSASDLQPIDPNPYLFLGRIQAAEKSVPDAVADRLRRFAELRPENALANYYYAVSLWKRRKSPQDGADVPKVESLLEKAIRIDPGLGAAYLQLGVLRAEQKDMSGAIAAYRKAIEANPRLEEAHYRLAQVYRQSGETERAEKEIQVYERMAAENAGEEDRERHEIKQFVYSLRGPSSASPPQ